MKTTSKRKEDTGRTILTVAIDNEMAERVDAAARANFLTRAVFVRQAVAAALRQAERINQNDNQAAA